MWDVGQQQQGQLNLKCGRCGYFFEKKKTENIRNFDSLNNKKNSNVEHSNEI
jgi:hypothetical protein